MSDEQLQNIFNSTIHNSRRGTNGEKGSGLGLHLCKEFIEKNNGELKIESLPHQGTTFHLFFKVVED